MSARIYKHPFHGELDLSKNGNSLEKPFIMDENIYHANKKKHACHIRYNHLGIQDNIYIVNKKSNEIKKMVDNDNVTIYHDIIFVICYLYKLFMKTFLNVTIHDFIATVKKIRCIACKQPSVSRPSLWQWTTYWNNNKDKILEFISKYLQPKIKKNWIKNIFGLIDNHYIELVSFQSSQIIPMGEKKRKEKYDYANKKVGEYKVAVQTLMHMQELEEFNTTQNMNAHKRKLRSSKSFINMIETHSKTLLKPLPKPLSMNVNKNIKTKNTQKHKNIKTL